jgi:Xaa-Pro dipeptidase
VDDYRFFSSDEYVQRLEAVRQQIEEHGLAGCLVSRPENIYYLTGLNYQGYFAYQMLVVPLRGAPILITRAMEGATVRDQVPDVLPSAAGSSSSVLASLAKSAAQV